MGSTFGYRGFTNVDGSRVLCREGARLSMPRNLDVPYPISNQIGGAVNYSDGLLYPVVNLPMIPMESTAPWFTAANINNWFVTRGSAPGYDLSELASDLIFSDNGIVSGAGLGTFKVVHAKGAGFTLGFQMGTPVSFDARFAGVTRNATALSNPTGGLDGSQLQFDRVVLGGTLASLPIIGGSIAYDTGLTPNPELNGTLNPKEHNADLPSLTMSITYNARAMDALGYDSSALDTYPEVTNAIVGIQSIRLTTPSWVVFTITRLVNQNPNDRTQQRGRVTRTFNYQAFANATAGSQILAVTQAASAPT